MDYSTQISFWSVQMNFHNEMKLVLCMLIRDNTQQVVHSMIVMDDVGAKNHLTQSGGWFASVEAIYNQSIMLVILAHEFRMAKKPPLYVIGIWLLKVNPHFSTNQNPELSVATV